MFAIEFAQVSRKFIIHHQRNSSFQEVVVNAFQQSNVRETFWALNDVSFQIQEGETLGIIGENGSGKSTVLKLMNRILEPTSGKVIVRGKVTALLELGAGFHPDLTGRENIFLNGSILGLSRREISTKLDDIVGFAELERFIDTPVKHYSSGMYMRLAFAIATSLDPEMLLVDEILAVGDEVFQRKCLDKMSELKRRCKAIVFVSHNLSAVRDLCTRAIWLEQGKIRADGSPIVVVDEYLDAANEKERIRLAQGLDDIVGAIKRWGTREIEITAVDFLNSHDQVCRVFATGETLKARIRFRASTKVDKPVFGVAIHREDGTHINGPNTRTAELEIDFLDGEGEISYIIPSLPLLEGNYHFSAAVYDYSCTHAYDHHDRAYPFKVQAKSVKERFGTLLIPSRWEFRESRGN